jgi:hypothetical protein
MGFSLQCVATVTPLSQPSLELAGRRMFISMENRRSLLEIKKPAETLI